MMSNPYLQSQADAITNQVNRNLTTNILPQIGSSAVAAGGYGGSRQGVAEGLAVGQTNQDLSNSLANLYGTNYQQDVGNALTAYGLQNQYNLGLGNLGLGNQQQLFNFYTQNRGLDQSGAQLGANLTNGANQGLVGQGQGIYNLGTTQQQAPWQVSGQAGNIFSQFSGLGGSQTQTQNGSALGALTGGAILGNQIVGNLGLGSSYTTPDSTGSYSNPSGSTYNYAGSYLPNSLRGGGG